MPETTTHHCEASDCFKQGTWREAFKKFYCDWHFGKMSKLSMGNIYD